MNKPSYGVIGGRFQVNDLHDGHMELFREVRARHNRVIVFVGIAPTAITRTNPLSFEARKKMIQSKFPEFTVLPLKDVGSDEFWSLKLDAAIMEIADYGDVTLYGGRDSFLPHYKGTFKPVELCLHGSISGTEVRESLTDTVLESSDFRAGIIHAAYNMRPRTFPTVDVIVMYNKADGDGTREGRKITPYVLMAAKPGEKVWRFVGGFAEPASESYEADAKREAYEETGLDINSLEYIGSALIDDWRYRDVPDKIETLVYIGWAHSMNAKAQDDIKECLWFPLEALLNSTGMELSINPTHYPILNLLRKHMEKKNANAPQSQSATADR